jgi:outer membrane biosynthesis protein TonB
MKKFALALPLIALLASGCASVSAKSKDAPGLNVPPPPPRVIEPAPEPLPEPVPDLPSTTAASPPNPSAPRPNRPRENRSPATDPKANEQKPVEPVTPPDPAPVAQPPAQPPAQLQTPQAADTNAARAVRSTIDRANGLLSGVDYGRLSNDRKKAYDDAKRFSQQAEASLKEGNVVFAQAVATKAETLARELAGR